MREVYLEGRLMTDRAAAHAEIKDKLSLPEYYGANLDALWRSGLCGADLFGHRHSQGGQKEDGSQR